MTEVYRTPLGRTVLCDACNKDYTDRADSGGIVFQSKGLCPACAPEWEADAKRFREEKFIKARCPEGQSFADFIREYRGPNAAVTMTSLDSIDEFLDFLERNRNHG